MRVRSTLEHSILRILFTGILSCCFLVNSASGQPGARRKPQPSPSPSPTATPTPTPSTSTTATVNVAAEIIQLNQKLRGLPDRLVSDATLANIEQEISVLRNSTAVKSQQTETTIQSGGIFTELQQSSVDWDALNSKVESLSKTLTNHSTALDNEIKALKSDESRWLAANEQARTQGAAPELLDLTSKAITDIRSALNLAEERRSRVLGMQQTVATQSSVISTEIDRLKKAKVESQRSLLEQDSLPLWKVQGGKQADESVGRVLRKSYADDVLRLKAFVGANRVALTGILVLTLLTVVFFLRLKRRLGIKTEPNLDHHSSLSQRPFSFGLLVFLIAMLPLLYAAPDIVIALVNLISIVPVVRLLKPRLSKTYQKVLIALIGTVLVWGVLKLAHFPMWLRRDLFALFALAAIVVFGWLARDARNNERAGTETALLAVFTGMLLLLIALLANVFGYVGLTDLVTQATVVSAYRGVSLYTVFVVGSVLISSMSLNRPTGYQTASVPERHRLGKRLVIALGAILFLIWIHTTLKLFAVREDFYSSLTDAFKYQIHIGSANIEVSNIVAFILTLLLGFLIASVIRAILGDEVLPRLQLEHGLPNAIATITHYALLVLVVLLALAAAGVELSKFTLLTGALGVGLGFGLQNIVNNFVSGLILLFERPVRIGDILEIGPVSGQVTKIGVRSTSLHAFDGSDLIVPNAKLISEQVVNWTLSGTRRQIVLNIPVAYGADPTQVRDLLCETVTSHPPVLSFPKPVVFFLGFGDNALNFEVRFWAARPDIVGELKSDVALNIASALTKAGFTVPVPRRDLHIMSADQRDGKAIDASKKFDD